MISIKRGIVIGLSVGVATFGLGALNSALLAQDRQSAPPSNASSNYDTFHNATPPLSTDNNSNNRGAQARERDHRTKRETRSERRASPVYGRAYNDRYYGNDNAYGSDQDGAWRGGNSGWNNGWNNGRNNGWNSSWNHGYYGADPYWGGNANRGEYAYWTYNNGYGYAPYYGNGYAPY